MDFESLEVMHLCKVSASSFSDDKYTSVKGDVRDPTSVKSDYGFCSEEELEPFFKIELPVSLDQFTIKVYFRSESLDKDFPFWIELRSSNRCLKRLELDSFGNGSIEISADEVMSKSSVDEIIFSREGVCSLIFRAIFIYVPANYFVEKYKNIAFDSVCFADGHYFGLGGKLNVYASAALYCSQIDRKMLCIDGSSKDLIQYPLSADGVSSRFGDLLDRYASTSIRNLVKGKSEYAKETHRAIHKPIRSPLGVNDNFSYISRNGLNGLRFQGESKLEVTRRAFKKIVPAPKVIERVRDIERRFSLIEKYGGALAIHFRHGNGERYYSKNKDLWGVKPASKETLRETLQRFFQDQSGRVNFIIVASDCPAVYNFICELVPSSCEVIYLDYGVQPLGAGCSHNSSVFDNSLERVFVDEDDEQIATFAQILALSKCAYLMGGKSYFFETVKAFSKAPKGNIYFIDNKDRYIRMHDNEIAVLESSAPGTGEVVEKLRWKEIKIDGLFFGVDDESVYLKYFDHLLVRARSIPKLVQRIDSSFYKKVETLRFY